MTVQPIPPQTEAEHLAVVGHLAEAMRLLGAPSDAPYAPRPDADGHALFALGMVYTHLGRPDDARAALADAAAWFRAREWYGDAARVTDWTLNECAIVYTLDDPAACDALAAAAERLYAQDAATPTYVPLLVRARLWARRGEWDAALALVRGIRETTGYAGRDDALLDILAGLARAQGDHYAAEAAVYTVFPAGPDTAPGGMFLPLALRTQRIAAALALEASDLDRARRWLEAHDDWLAWSGATVGRADGAVAWTRHHRATGEVARATETADRALALAAAPRQPFALLVAHRLRGALATEAADWATATRHLDAAAALAEACMMPNERVQTRVTRAGLHAARGERDEAVRLLRAAGAEAAAIGAVAAANRVRVRLARLTNAPVVPPAPVPPAPLPPVSLTAREREVLRLVAAGRGNREIADSLSISEYTVHTHVRRILAKTGTENRAAAAGFAHRHGLA